MGRRRRRRTRTRRKQRLPHLGRVLVVDVLAHESLVLEELATQRAPELARLLLDCVLQVKRLDVSGKLALKLDIDAIDRREVGYVGVDGGDAA